MLNAWLKNKTLIGHFTVKNEIYQFDWRDLKDNELTKKIKIYVCLTLLNVTFIALIETFEKDNVLVLMKSLYLRSP